MLDHSHQKLQHQLVGNFHAYLHEKNNFIIYCTEIANLLLWVQHSWLRTPKVILSTRRRLLCLSAGKKSTSSPRFSRFIAKICSISRFDFLFWVLWAYLGKDTQNYSINWQKTLMLICMPKIHFIVLLLLGILHFKESCNLIGEQHFNPKLKNQNSVKYEIGSEISITILVFILDYFQEKLMPEFFKTPEKKYIYMWHHFGPFLPKFAQKMNFLRKKASVSF